MLINKKEGNILDVACGTGVNIVQLKKINPKANFYGCDISKVLLSRAENKGIQKKFLECIKILPGMIYNSPRQLCLNTQEIKCSPQIHKECLRLFQRLTI